ALADAAADPSVRAFDHAVPHRVVGVDLPAEEAAVEPAQLLAVLAGDLEPRHLVCHDCLLSVAVVGTTNDRARNRQPQPATTTAACPSRPAKRGTTSTTPTRAQKRMSSSRPCGPYVRAVSPASGSGKERATSSAAIAASERSASSSCTIRPAQ